MEDYLRSDVLLVEDNPYDAELTIRALKKQGLANKIFHAVDGVEALDFLFCRGKFTDRDIYNPVKVVLLDLKLPKLNGLEVLKEVKSNPVTAKIPIVVLTSSREDPDMTKAYELGVNSYVVKPVDFDDFIKAVQQTGLFWLLVNETEK